MRSDDVDQVYAVLGHRIRELRHDKGLTQIDLAHALGLSRTSIANIEVGRQRILMHQLLQLADVFHTSPQNLLIALGDPHIDPDTGERLPSETLAWIEKARAQNGR